MDAISVTAAGGRSVSDGNMFVFVSRAGSKAEAGLIVGCGRPIDDRRVVSGEFTTDSRPGAQCPLTPTTGSALRPSRYLVVVGAGEMRPVHDGYIPEEVRKCLTWVAECTMAMRAAFRDRTGCAARATVDGSRREP